MARAYGIEKYLSGRISVTGLRSASHHTGVASCPPAKLAPAGNWSTKTSKSHFIDCNGKTLDHPASNRYFCTHCDVPPVNARPLVESDFKSPAAK